MFILSLALSGERISAAFLALYAAFAFAFYFFSTLIVIVDESGLSSKSSLSYKSFLAMPRLAAYSLESWHLTCSPVGLCNNTTQLFDLFVFCPPGPKPLMNCSSKSASLS